MRFTVRIVDGRTQRQDRFDAPRIRLGRDAGCDVVLRDLRIPLVWATIEWRQGRPWMRSAGQRPLLVDGVLAAEAELAAGSRIEAGRFELCVDALGPEELVLTVTARHAEADSIAAERSRIRASLEELRLPLRPLAWLAFLVILGVGLLLPYAARFGIPGNEAVAATLPQGLDWIWISGPISHAHAHFGRSDCGRCHVQPFVPAGVAECRDCHARLPAHGHGEQPAAEALAPCTACHLEHEDARTMIVEASVTCIGCHARSDGERVPRAVSFATEHPEIGPRSGRPVPGGGLRFPHDLHLSADGVAGPGGRRVLDCGDCHEPDRAGGFRVVRMERHCADCHALGVDPEHPLRRVPHGELLQVREALEQILAREAFDAAGRRSDLRRRPGSAGDAPADEDLRAQAQRLLVDVVERRVCTTCHGLERPGEHGLPWRIAPVELPERYYAAAHFDHRDHASADCADCHDARHSDRAEDVLLPGREACVDCHGRVADRNTGLARCGLCHDYHAAQARWPLDWSPAP